MFGKVENVMVIDHNKVAFKYTSLEVLEYNEHLNSYQVQPTNEVKIILKHNLADFLPLGLYKGFGGNSEKQFVVLRYRVDCMQ